VVQAHDHYAQSRNAVRRPGPARTLPAMERFPDEIIEHYDHEIDEALPVSLW
jgi:hypothetical protein